MKTEKAIGLWLDETGAEPSAWIVSLDDLDPDGNAENTETLMTFDEDEHDVALEYANKVASEKGLTVVEI